MPLFTVGEVYTAALANKLAMTPTAQSSNYNAVDGDLVEMTGHFNAALPSPSPAQQRIGLISINGTGAAPAGLTCPGTVIIGPGIAATVNGLLLGAPGAYAVVESDGAQWLLIAGKQDTGWLAASGFTNSWAAASPIPQYRLVDNEVELTGGIYGGTTGDPAFTLPAGYRPPAICRFGVTDTSGLNVLSSVKIDTNGNVTPYSGTTGDGVSLDNVRFTID